MATLRRFDIMLNGKGYMLARGSSKGRSWQRSGLSDAPSRRSDTDAKYGQLPDQIDHPEVWDDWSGGFGYPYRRAGENTYHWAENFDARFPRQLVHCQQPLTAEETYTMSAELVASSAPATFTRCNEITDSTSIMGQGKGGVISLLGWANQTSVTPIDNKTLQVVWAESEFSSQFMHPAATWGSYHFAGMSASQSTAIRSNGNWLAIDVPAFRYATIGGRLWRTHGLGERKAHFLQSTANITMSLMGTSSDWSATLMVGNYSAPILDLIGYNGQIVAGMPNGLFVGDRSGTFVNVLDEFEKQLHDDNCRDLCVHNNAVIVPYGGGVLSYQSYETVAQINQISPPAGARSPVTGRIRTVRGRGRWLYAGLYTGSQAWLLAAEKGDNSYVWHTLQRFPHSIKPSRMHVDNLTVASGGDVIPPRFWLAADASIDTGGTAPVYWWCTPYEDDNPLAPSAGFSANYVGSARIDFGAVDWGSPSTPKTYRAVEVWANNLASGAQWARVYYTIDESASRALLGTVAKSPKDTLYFPGDEGKWVTGQSIALSVESFTASAGITPIYRAFILRGTLRPGSADQITAQIKIGDNIRDRQGAAMRSGAVMISELRELAKANHPTHLIDLAGAAQYVTVIPPVQEAETYQSGDDNPEVIATIQMAVLTFS